MFLSFSKIQAVDVMFRFHKNGAYRATPKDGVTVETVADAYFKGQNTEVDARSHSSLSSNFSADAVKPELSKDLQASHGIDKERLPTTRTFWLKRRFTLVWEIIRNVDKLRSF